LLYHCVRLTPSAPIVETTVTRAKRFPGARRSRTKRFELTTLQSTAAPHR
jgi:hypothetical protein